MIVQCNSAVRLFNYRFAILTRVEFKALIPIEHFSGAFYECCILIVLIIRVVVFTKENWDYFQMPNEVKEVFGDVFDYPTNLIKAMEFQDFHRSRLLIHHKVLVKIYNLLFVVWNELYWINNKEFAKDQKYQAIKDIIKDMKTKLQILDQKYQSAKMLIRHKEEAINELNRYCNWIENRRI